MTLLLWMRYSLAVLCELYEGKIHGQISSSSMEEKDNSLMPLKL